MPEESLTFALEYDSDDQIPEPVKSLYKQNESGKFVLFAESKTKVNKFRDERTKALKERDELLKRISDLEPQAAKAKEYEPYYKKLKEIEENQLFEEEKKALATGLLKVDDIVSNRTKQKLQDWESEKNNLQSLLKEKESALQDLNNKLAYNEIKYNIQAQLGKVEKTAVLRRSETDVIQPEDIIVGKAQEVWKNEDGKLIPRYPSWYPHGETGQIWYGKDGTNPISFAEWAMLLPKMMSSLFETSQGSGNIGNGLTSGSRSGKGMTYEEAKMNPIALMNRAHQKKK